MTVKHSSALTLLLLLVLLALAGSLNILLPQGDLVSSMTQGKTLQIPVWQLMLGSAGMILVLYGLLGFLGFLLWRKIGFPEIWEPSVNNRQRFAIPALVGLGLGIVLIISDLVFSPINGIGRLIHPPFPTSLVASFSAGVGEEILFRLFFVSLWTWLIGKLLLRGRGLNIVYWVVSVFSALAFSASHLPSLMLLTGVSDPLQFPAVLLLEILLLNSLISLFGAYYFRKYGFLAAVGIHFWTDIVWHMLWGLV